ncbi:hypothetical protein A6A05_01350 [Magnetospirillum moscoviense]|uniref:Uncharacterized protein n=2 Tax=Magnetospirillum moscoviense TaxID=1437059 RepID=A0A178MRP2_9PROT|nr:hypothetical protein A6A05_01350 [Magnetospirillum moscoviense]
MPLPLAKLRGYSTPLPSGTDPALLRIIQRSVTDARDAGLDQCGQTRQAAEAVQRVRPDFAADEALTLVQRTRD